MVKKIILMLCMWVFMVQNPGWAANREKIALVMKDLFNPFFQKMEAGAKAYSEKHKIDLEVFGVERETEVNRQISIVDNLITRRYGAIVIAPADSKALIDVCKKAIQQGIVVVNIDNPFHKRTLDELDIKIPFVGSDNRVGASMVGDYIRHQLHGKGRVIIVEGIRGAENADLRKKGFVESLTSGSQIEIVASESANWHKDEAFSLMTGLLKKYPGIDAVLCANDMMALGAIQVLEIMNRAGKIRVGAYDNIEEARLEMSNGHMHATIEQHPELMGQYGVELAAEAMSGRRVPDYTPTPLDLITYEGFNKKVCLSLSNVSNPFFKMMANAAIDAAELFGIKLTVVDAQNDDAVQLIDLQNCIREKFDLIILNPTNADTVSTAIEMADQTGVKVITVDRKSSREDLVVSHVASDNVLGGRMAAEFIAHQLNGKGNILEIEGIPGASATHERGMGFNQAIQAYPDIKVGSREVGYFDRQKARSITEHLIEKGRVFDAVFAHNDNMILGVIDAYEALKTEKPKVLIGFDAIPEAVAAIKDRRITATIAQNPEAIGKIAVRTALDFFRGLPLPGLIRVDLELISAD